MPREMIDRIVKRDRPMGFELRVKYTILVMFVTMVGAMVAGFWYTNSAIAQSEHDLCAAIQIQATPDPPPTTVRGKEIAAVFRELARKKGC